MADALADAIAEAIHTAHDADELHTAHSWPEAEASIAADVAREWMEGKTVVRGRAYGIVSADLIPIDETRFVVAFCPACDIERTDYEGPNAHLSTCPNCGSARDPIEQETP